MQVYQLLVEAYSTRYGELQEKNSYKCEVYASIEKAVKEGKNWLNSKLERLYEMSNYCTKEKNDLTLQDLLEDNLIFYDFRVIELDPVYADNFVVPEHEYECKEIPPTHTNYIYNIAGKLQYKILEYRSNKSNFGYQITQYPRR